MNNTLEKTKTKPKLKIVGNIFETSDYDIFNDIDGNRDVNASHVEKLVASMKIKYYISPIIVNGKMQIIDGQHRYTAAKTLGLPVRYIVDEDADINAVRALNEKNKNWNPDDFVNCYIQLGNEEYIRYKEFKDKYKLNHKSCQMLLSTSHDNGHRGFNSGVFKINRYQFACTVAERVNQCLEFYDGAHRRSFINSMILVSKNLYFDFKVFIKRLESQRGKMYDCAKTEQYIALIEEIYNYRNRKKINLRI